MSLFQEIVTVFMLTLKIIWKEQKDTFFNEVREEEDGSI